jgi:hypothetical protein
LLRVIGDPARGIVTWNLSFLDQCYSGSLLIFNKPDRPPA